MRLDKYLAHALNITRKNSRILIKDNQIRVNKIIITDPGYYINEDIDEVFYTDNKINYHEFIYLMLNKPSGVISATKDDVHTTVIDILGDEYKHSNLFPVGRLDIDTEGLLLITNNGKLNHFLTSPNHDVTKKYYAKIDGVVTESDIHFFKNGMWLNDGKGEKYFTKPAILEIIKSGSISEVYVLITEGKFHQVKKMFHSVGKEVIYLKRVMMKEISLDHDLQPGQYRKLTEEEINKLKSGFNLM